MPLRDHFHPPLSNHRHWTSLHSNWANVIATELNRGLPQEYFAEPNVQFGIEIDVATFERVGSGVAGSGDRALQSWTPPAPALTIPFSRTTDIVEVAVYESSGGPILVGAIEIVSPANKDRPEHREAFVAKCETLVQEGVGLAVVDIVTDRHANLHAALLERLGESRENGSPRSLYASAYRPVDRNGDSNLEIWHESLSVGQELPTIPLWLRGGPCMPINLESTYMQMCQNLRIGDDL
jgi:hypothetical protein